MTKPIRPQDLRKAMLNYKRVPDEVIKCFNAAIAEKFDGRESSFTQGYIVGLIAEAIGCSGWGGGVRETLAGRGELLPPGRLGGKIRQARLE